ncbi:hypothetical protein Micbo1qcDRAFT_225766 [Microdochium bolleyi]|uniref:Uncharacterized protein n=1 Tax=Microdochium bolleyi TaxID=196109 RepID=A0A136J1J6_9PEZI|nr:hypothetical protein Micbo1qcDRAFT_225766 [Microdochium bolleyi]
MALRTQMDTAPAQEMTTAKQGVEKDHRSPTPVGSHVLAELVMSSQIDLLLVSHRGLQSSSEIHPVPRKLRHRRYLEVNYGREGTPPAGAKQGRSGGRRHQTLLPEPLHARTELAEIAVHSSAGGSDALWCQGPAARPQSSALVLTFACFTPTTWAVPPEQNSQTKK